MARRLICLVLALCLGVCLWACSQSPAAQSPGFQAGFARVSITPDTSMPLAGSGDSMDRMSLGILDMLWVNCVALTDQSGQTVLLVTLDLLAIDQAADASLRNAITVATGVGSDRIFLTPLGTCNAPDLSADFDSGMSTYRQLLKTATAQAAQDALADLAPATVKEASVKLKSLNFTDHYLDEDGQCLWGEEDGVPARHAGQADNRARLIRLVRGKSKDILLMNWQVRPNLAADPDSHSYQMISADLAGRLRTQVEKAAGVHAVYFQGAAWDLTPVSRLADEPRSSTPDKYAQKAAGTIAGAARDMDNIQAGVVLLTRHSLTLTPEVPEEGLLKAARRMVQLWDSGHGAETWRAPGRSWGITSIEEARAIIARADTPPVTLELSALRIGDMAFVSLPCNLSDSTGQALREKAPFDTMFLLCNSGGPAIPPAERYENGCPEASLSLLPQGSAEALTAACLEMLQRIQ